MAITVVGTDTNATASGTPVAPVYPSGIGANDLILIAVVVNAAGTVTTPSGFTLVDTQSSATTKTFFYAKYAAGSESGTLNIAFATATRVDASIHVRRGVFTSVAANISTPVKNTNAGAAAITTTAMTSVPAGARLMVFGGNTHALGTGTTCTVTGTNWSEITDISSGAGTPRTQLDVAENTTDTGTANTCTMTWTSIGDNICTISFYLFENPPTNTGNSFFGCM